MKKLIYANKGIAGELADELNKTRPLRIMASQHRIIMGALNKAMGLTQEDRLLQEESVCGLCNDSGKYQVANGEADFDWDICLCEKGREFQRRQRMEEMMSDDAQQNG